MNFSTMYFSLLGVYNRCIFGSGIGHCLSLLARSLKLADVEVHPPLFLTTHHPPTFLLRLYSMCAYFMCLVLILNSFKSTVLFLVDFSRTVYNAIYFITIVVVSSSNNMLSCCYYITLCRIYVIYITVMCLPK